MLHSLILKCPTVKRGEVGWMYSTIQSPPCGDATYTNPSPLRGTPFITPFRHYTISHHTTPYYSIVE